MKRNWVEGERTTVLGPRFQPFKVRQNSSTFLYRENRSADHPRSNSIINTNTII